MANPGVDQFIAGGGYIEASCRGAIDYMITAGYPADQIVMGMPFYSSGWGYWMDAPSDANDISPDENYTEAYVGGAYWTTPNAIEMKMNAVLDPASSVLTGGTTLGGVGGWEWGHEDPASPDLSQAIKDKALTY